MFNFTNEEIMSVQYSKEYALAMLQNDLKNGKIVDYYNDMTFKEIGDITLKSLNEKNICNSLSTTLNEYDVILHSNDATPRFLHTVMKEYSDLLDVKGEDVSKYYLELMFREPTKEDLILAQSNPEIMDYLGKHSGLSGLYDKYFQEDLLTNAGSWGKEYINVVYDKLKNTQISAKTIHLNNMLKLEPYALDFDLSQELYHASTADELNLGQRNVKRSVANLDTSNPLDERHIRTEAAIQLYAASEALWNYSKAPIEGVFLEEKYDPRSTLPITALTKDKTQIMHEQDRLLEEYFNHRQGVAECEFKIENKMFENRVASRSQEDNLNSNINKFEDIVNNKKTFMEFKQEKINAISKEFNTAFDNGEIEDCMSMIKNQDKNSLSQKEMSKKFLSKYGTLITSLPENIILDKECQEVALKSNKNTKIYLNKWLNDNNIKEKEEAKVSEGDIESMKKFFCVLLIQKPDEAIDYLNNIENRGHLRALALEMVNINPIYLSEVNKDLRNDRSFMKEAIEINPISFKYASRNLKADEDFTNFAVMNAKNENQEERFMYFHKEAVRKMNESQSESQSDGEGEGRGQGSQTSSTFSPKPNSKQSENENKKNEILAKLSISESLKIGISEVTKDSITNEQVATKKPFVSFLNKGSIEKAREVEQPKQTQATTLKMK